MTDTRREIEDLLVRLAWIQDHQDNAGFSSHFTQDCVFDAMLRVCRGPADIDAFFAERAKVLGSDVAGRGRHLVTNLILHEIRPDFVRAQHIQLVFAGVGPGPFPAVPGLVLDVNDEIVRSGDGPWLIARRDMAVAFGGMPQPRQR